MASSRRSFCSSLLLSSLAGVRAAERTGELSAQYRESASRLIGAALTDDDGYQKLSYLCDRIGNRLSGSASLERAITWSAEQMKRDGLRNVVTPAVKVPHWVRGRESAELVEPVRRVLPMLGLGGSVGTPAAGVSAAVVSVTSFSELDRLGEAGVRGKIVLFNVPYEGYGKTVQYRVSGASRAGKLGAVGTLLRSVGSSSLQTPHTGVMDYENGAPQVPAAAITPEDAQLIQRLIDSGETVRVTLKMEAKSLPDATSANVIGEIPGREKPEEIVVMGGHIDSWDVGQGAQDDGSGCVAALQAAALVQKLNLRPRRTLRVAFWTNEENGTRGAQAYHKWAGESVRKHVAAIEMDGGAEKPTGFGLTVMGPGASRNDAAQAKARQIGKMLDGIEAGTIFSRGGGADIAPLMQDGVPGLGLITVGTHYFDWHHTQADTVDKVKPQDFRLNIAAMAVMAYTLADMPGTLID